MGENHFKILGLRPRLVLTADELRRNYDERCRIAHPDSGGERADFERLRLSYVELLSPGCRLRHWLSLAGVEILEGGVVPPLVSRRFEKISPLLQHAGEIEQRHKNAKSVLVRSMAEAEGVALLAKLEEARRETEQHLAELEEQFFDFEEAGAAAVEEEAVQTVRSLLFLEKWISRLREAWGKMGCW